MTSSPTPLLDRREELLDFDTDEELMDSNRSKEPHSNGPEVGSSHGGGGGHRSYGSVPEKTDQAPPLEEKTKKKHRASSVVSLTSFGEVGSNC